MKKHTIFSFTVLLLILSACTSEKPEEAISPLLGVWERVSAEFHLEDSVLIIPDPAYPDLKSMKIFTKGHFCTIGMGGPDGASWSFAGTYTVGDGEYTQTNDISTTNNLGKSLTMKFTIDGDTLNQESDWHKEVWVRIE